MHSWFTFANLCLSEAWIHQVVRLSKCANQGGFYTTLASGLDLSWFLIAFSPFFPLYMFLWVCTPQKNIHQLVSELRLLSLAKLLSHPKHKKKNQKYKNHKNSPNTSTTNSHLCQARKLARPPRATKTRPCHPLPIRKQPPLTPKPSCLLASLPSKWPSKLWERRPSKKPKLSTYNHNLAKWWKRRKESPRSRETYFHGWFYFNQNWRKKRRWLPKLIWGQIIFNKGSMMDIPPSPLI